MNAIASRFPLSLLFVLLLASVAACRPAAPSVEPNAPDVVANEELSTQAPPPALPPVVATDPPPPPDDEPLLPPLVLNGSQPQGTDAVAGELSYDPNALLRIDARRIDGPDEPGAGIAAVEFRISTAAGQALYTYVDYAPGYCVFGGGEPTCNSWPFVDGDFRWGEGGPPIEPGQYNGQAVFHYTPNGGDGYGGVAEESWRFSFEIAAP